MAHLHPPDSPASEASYYSYSEYTLAPSEKSVNRRWYDRLDTWRHNIEDKARPGLLRKISEGSGSGNGYGYGNGHAGMGNGSVMTIGTSNPFGYGAGGGAGDSRSRLGFYGVGEEEDVYPKESISSRPSPKRLPSLPLVPMMQQPAAQPHRPSPPPPPQVQAMYRQEPVINVAGMAESVPVGMGGAGGSGMNGRYAAREMAPGMRTSIAGSFDEPPESAGRRGIDPGLGLRMGTDPDHTISIYAASQGIQTPMRVAPVEMRDGTILMGAQATKLHPITNPYRLPLPASTTSTFITPPRVQPVIRPSPGPIPGSLHLPRTAMSQAHMQAGRRGMEPVVMERDLPPLPPSTFADSETGSTVTATPRAGGMRYLPQGRSASVARRSQYATSTQPPPIAPKPPNQAHRAPPPPSQQAVRASQTVAEAVDRLNSILEYPSSEASGQYLDLPSRTSGKKEKENARYRPPTPYHPPKAMAFSDVESSVASGTIVGSRRPDAGDDSESTIQGVIEKNSKVRSAAPATPARVAELLEHPQKVERKRYPDAPPTAISHSPIIDTATPKAVQAQLPSQLQPEIVRSTFVEVPGDAGHRSVIQKDNGAARIQSRPSGVSRHSNVSSQRLSHIPGVSSPLAANVADYQAGATGSRPASVAASVLSARGPPTARSAVAVPARQDETSKQSKAASSKATSRPASLHSGSGDSSSDATIRLISTVVPQHNAAVQTDTGDAHSVVSRGRSHKASKDHRPPQLEPVAEQLVAKDGNERGEHRKSEDRSRDTSRSKNSPKDRHAAARLTPPDSAKSDGSSDHRKERVPLEKKDSHTSSWVTTHVSDSPRSRRRNLKGGRKEEESYSSESDSSSKRRRRRRRSPSPERHRMMLPSPPQIHPMAMSQSMMSPMLSPPLYPPRPPMTLPTGPAPQLMLAAQQAQMMPMLPQGPPMRPRPGPIMSPPPSMYGYGWNPGMSQPQSQQQGNYFDAGRPMSAVQMGSNPPMNAGLVTRGTMSAPATAFAANYQDPRRSLTGSDPARLSGMILGPPAMRPERMRRSTRMPGNRPRTGTTRLPGSRPRRDRMALPLMVPTVGRMPPPNPQIIDPMARRAGMGNMAGRRTTRQPGMSRARPGVPGARATRQRGPGVTSGRTRGNAAVPGPAAAVGQSRGWMRGLLPKKGGGS